MTQADLIQIWVKVNKEVPIYPEDCKIKRAYKEVQRTKLINKYRKEFLENERNAAKKI